MVRPCDCASCTFHTWRYGTGYGTLQAQSPCPSLPVQTPAQICCPWPTYIEHNHQHIHACLPQVTVPTAPAKPEKEGEKKPKEKSKTALLPPSKAATVVSAASTQLSAASTAVLSKAPTAKHPSKANTPPSVGPGGNYMYPPQHTKLHIFNKAAKVWDVKYATQKLKFKIFTASTLLTPAMVVENTTGTSATRQRIGSSRKSLSRGMVAGPKARRSPTRNPGRKIRSQAWAG